MIHLTHRLIESKGRRGDYVYSHPFIYRIPDVPVAALMVCDLSSELVCERKAVAVLAAYRLSFVRMRMGHKSRRPRLSALG